MNRLFAAVFSALLVLSGMTGLVYSENIVTKIVHVFVKPKPTVQTAQSPYYEGEVICMKTSQDDGTCAVMRHNAWVRSTTAETNDAISKGKLMIVFPTGLEPAPPEPKDDIPNDTKD